jgi:hypothetical protein
MQWLDLKQVLTGQGWSALIGYIGPGVVARWRGQVGD